MKLSIASASENQEWRLPHQDSLPLGGLMPMKSCRETKKNFKNGTDPSNQKMKDAPPASPWNLLCTTRMIKCPVREL